MARAVATAPANGHGHSEDSFDCPMFRMLPKPLQEQSREKPHLWGYLHDLHVDEIGIPDFAATLGKKHKDVARPNLVYPAGKGIFIHIRPDNEDSRDFYVTIEPTALPRLNELTIQVDSRLMHYVDELKGAANDDERTQVLLGLVDQVCAVEGQNGAGLLGGLFRPRGKILVSAEELGALKYVVIRDKAGLSILEPLITDPYIEDISCSGVGPLFIEHKVFGGLKASVKFETTDELDRYVLKLSEKIGRPVTFRAPIVDATLPDGSRVNIVYGGDVSKRGSNFTIRKFSTTPLSMLDLIGFGALSYEMAAYLSFMMRAGMNVFVSGETASGKTTLLNALTVFIDPTAKIVSIEDTPELQVPHPNWTREVVRGASKEQGASGVTMMDLLKAALRQRPNEIIIGEIRGEEGAIAFQAMQTGHACMATFHASTVEKLIQRLTGEPINIPKTYIDNLNVVVIASAVRLPTGKSGRRLISISEITGYESSTDSFSYVEVFRWNPATDKHEFVGFQNSYLLEHVIAPRRGLLPHNRRMIYSELEQRANILRKLQEKNVGNFYEFYNVLAKAYREGLFR